MAKNYYLAVKHLATEELMGVIQLPKDSADEVLVQRIRDVCDSHFDARILIAPLTIEIEDCIFCRKTEIKIDVEYRGRTEEETIEISETFLY